MYLAVIIIFVTLITILVLKDFFQKKNMMSPENSSATLTKSVEESNIEKVCDVLSDFGIILLGALIAIVLTNCSERKKDEETVQAVINVAQEDTRAQLEKVRDVFVDTGSNLDRKIHEKYPEYINVFAQGEAETLVEDPFAIQSVEYDIYDIAYSFSDSIVDVLGSETVLNNAPPALIIEAISLRNRTLAQIDKLKIDLEEIEDRDYTCLIYLDLYRIGECLSDEYNNYDKIKKVIDGKDDIYDFSYETLYDFGIDSVYERTLSSEKVKKSEKNALIHFIPSYDIANLYDDINRYVILAGPFAEDFMYADYSELRHYVARKYYEEKMIEMFNDDTN